MQSIRALVVVAALVAAPPLAAQVTVTPTEAVADRLLAAHNAERVRLGLKPLVWSAKLADHAKTWAQTLATSNMFEHAPVGADGGEGENLWYGSKDDYTPEEMIGFFIDEGKLFKRGKFPDVATNGVWEDVGHYTQLVWKDTREVGCTVASNPQRDFLVCRYLPAGNIIGQPVYDYKAADRLAKDMAAAMPTGKTSGTPESTLQASPPRDPNRRPDNLVGLAPSKSTVAEPSVPQSKATPSVQKQRASKKRRRGG